MKTIHAYKNKSQGMTPASLPQCRNDGSTGHQLQKKDSGGQNVAAAPSIVSNVLSSSGGRSMDTGTRSFMESQFSYDFSNVIIHDNDVAAKSADSINALAYTSGNNIVFNSGQYDPGSRSGRKLLAHELTHVVQQNESRSDAAGRMDIIQRQPSQENDPCSTDKIWGTWDAMKEMLCSMKCDISFGGEDCRKECTDKHGIWSKLKRCRQEHPLPPTPDPWDESD